MALAKLKVNPDESWQSAAAMLKSTVHFSSSFTTAIRALHLNHITNVSRGLDPTWLNPLSQFSTMRLFRAASIKAPLYYLTLTFRPRELEGRKYISLDELVSLYTADELAAVLALIYTFSSLRKACDKEEWQRCAKMINESVEIGGYLGQTLPEVGFARGILFSGMRVMSQAVFLSKNIKAYRNYRRDTKIKKVGYDPQMEYDLFSCTHIDLATQMLQSIGLGVEVSTSFYASLVTLPNKPLKTEANLSRILLLWTEALYLGKKPPVIHGENEIAVGEDLLDQLHLVSKQIQESGSTYNWLSKGKSSITRELAPMLYPQEEDTGDIDPDALNLEETQLQA